MRVRILKRPTGDAAGISLNRFGPGFVYDVGTHMGNLLLAEGFAEPVDDDRPAMLVPLADDGAPRSILIIDDDQQTRTMLTTLLTLQGYATQSAADGRDGLDKLRKHSPTLILLDLRMPAMDGFAFRTAQAKLPKPFCDVPVVVISGVEGADREVKRLNAVEFVAKPIDDDALLRVIRSHFELRRAANGHR